MSLHKAHGGVKAPHQTSAKVHSPAGSGSRPTKSAHKVHTSAPHDAHKLGRAPSGALK